jgi:DNA-binding beta-propeller fold protein YncE
LIVGSGPHRYEVIHDWGTLPPGIRYGNTHGVCEDRQGNIYIKHTVNSTSESRDALVVFDADGRFIRSWGADYQGGAHGLHIHDDKDGQFLYLCDCVRGIVRKTTLKGDKIWELRAPMDSRVYTNASEFKPTNVAIAPTGDVYVADGYGKSYIHIYNAKGEYQRTFGGPGSEPGQLSCPHGIMVDTRRPEPRLVVADRSNRRLQYFSLAGEHLGFVKDELRSPCHFHQRNGVLLVPDLEARVTLFDRDDKLLAHLGDGQNFNLRTKPREQFIAGQFIAPHSAIFDHAGNIFVVEWVEVGRVTKLRRLA